MKRTARDIAITGILSLALLGAVGAYAQPGGAKGGHADMGGPGAQQMGGMMHEADQMMEMSGRMSQGQMTPEQQKQMAERMRIMATMMDRMSGMAGKGMMMDADMQKQIGEMRRQMDDMMKGGGTASKKNVDRPRHAVCGCGPVPG